MEEKLFISSDSESDRLIKPNIKTNKGITDILNNNIIIIAMEAAMNKNTFTINSNVI